MKKIISILFVLVLVLGLLSGCGKKSADKKEENAGKEALTVSLKANATTGYQWNVSPSEKKIVKIKGSYKEDKHPKGMAGVGGKQIYKITPLKKGNVNLTFTYVAPGTKNIELVAVYELSVDKNLKIYEKKHYGTYFDQDNIEESKCFVIRLPYDSNSGYLWKCSIDKEKLVKCNESYIIGTDVESGEDENLDATQLFAVEGASKGEVTLTFTYESEEETEPKYTAVYKLNVSEKKIVTEISKSGTFFER